MLISVNKLLKWIDDPTESKSSRIERVIFIDDTGFDVACFNVDQKRCEPVFYKYEDIKAALESGGACLLEIDHRAPLFLTNNDLEDAKYKHVKRIRDERWEVIEPLVAGENHFKVLFPRERAALIKERAKVKFKHGKNGEEITYSRQSIYTFLQLWWRGGQTKNALLGQYLNCGAKGKDRLQNEKKLGRPSRITQATKRATGVVLTRRWLNIINLGILLFFNNQKNQSIRTAYRRTLEHFCPLGKSHNEKGENIVILPDYTKGEVFSPRQFQYRLHKEVNRNLRRFFKNKLGERRFNLRARELKGNSTDQAPYPGALYQIDGTIADVNLVSRLNRKHIIGRPVIIVIIDVFSRMIVGFCVRLEREGWLVISLAIKNATEDKVPFCKKYDVDITRDQWPVIDLCDYITGDRGPMIGYNADNLADGLNVGVSNTPPFRADWKGIVEQIFRLMNIRIIRDLPGALNPNYERGDRDIRLDAVLDIEQFTAIIVKAILYHNNHNYMSWYPQTKDMISAGVHPIPRELFRWGMENLSGKPRHKDSETIRIHLLPGGEATVTPLGIRFKGEFFTCDLAEKEGWRFRARNQGNWKVKIAYDPRVPEIIYLRYADGLPSIPCNLINPESLAIVSDWLEIDCYHEVKKIDDQHEEIPAMQARSILDSQVAEIVSQAEMMASEIRDNAPKESTRSRLRNINEQKNAEIERINEEDRKQILRESGLIDSPDTSDFAKNSDEEDGEHIPRPRLSNVLSIQERMMKQEYGQEN